jgi:hypothetical protein
VGVDLFDMGADGAVIWHWMCRFWEGDDVLELVDPAPSQPWWGAWDGPITRGQIEILREKAGGRQREADFRVSQRRFGVEPDADLDELLAAPVHHSASVSKNGDTGR